jgi:hypothetical protein
MRAFYTLSEQIFAAPSSAEIAEKLAKLCLNLQATTVRLYRGTAGETRSNRFPLPPIPNRWPSHSSAPRAWRQAREMFPKLERLNLPDVDETPW